jgi:hypothetical protein
MPQLRSIPTAQLCARSMPGDPVRRGPTESRSACASGSRRERSVASSQIALSTGSSMARRCASAAAGVATETATARAVAEKSIRVDIALAR